MAAVTDPDDACLFALACYLLQQLDRRGPSRLGEGPVWLHAAAKHTGDILGPKYPVPTVMPLHLDDPFGRTQSRELREPSLIVLFLVRHSASL
jgi:hypothetical protein